MHLHPNSSNLAARFLEQSSQFRDKLAQFCGYRAIVRAKYQGLPLQLQHMAGARQRRRGQPFIQALQRNKLLRLAG